MDPFNAEKPFVVSHAPLLPALEAVGVNRGKMSVEELLDQCVAVRSRGLLQEMVEGLKGSPWEGQGGRGALPPASAGCRLCGLSLQRSFVRHHSHWW